MEGYNGVLCLFVFQKTLWILEVVRFGVVLLRQNIRFPIPNDYILDGFLTPVPTLNGSTLNIYNQTDLLRTQTLNFRNFFWEEDLGEVIPEEVWVEILEHRQIFFWCRTWS